MDFLMKIESVSGVNEGDDWEVGGERDR